MTIKIREIEQQIKESEEVLHFLRVRQRENELFALAELVAKADNEDLEATPLAEDVTAAQVISALLHRLRRLEERVRVLEPDFFEPTFRIPENIKKYT